MTPEELAKLIIKSGTDEIQYAKYFEFKKRGIPEHFRKITEMSYSHPNALCRICDLYLRHSHNKSKNALFMH